MSKLKHQAGGQKTVAPCARGAQPESRPPEFTIAEHLGVQREIEQRAHHIWLAKLAAAGDAAGDWLRAEAEVLAEFVHARQPASRRRLPATRRASR